MQLHDKRLLSLKMSSDAGMIHRFEVYENPIRQDAGYDRPYADRGKLEHHNEYQNDGKYTHQRAATENGKRLCRIHLHSPEGPAAQHEKVYAIDSAANKPAAEVFRLSQKEQQSCHQKGQAQ